MVLRTEEEEELVFGIGYEGEIERDLDFMEQVQLL